MAKGALPLPMFQKKVYSAPTHYVIFIAHWNTPPSGTDETKGEGEDENDGWEDVVKYLG